MGSSSEARRLSGLSADKRIEAIADALDEAIENGYSDGHEDGYQEGVKDSGNARLTGLSEALEICERALIDKVLGIARDVEYIKSEIESLIRAQTR